MNLMPVFLDFETFVSKSATLKRLSLGQYFDAIGRAKGILGLAVALGDEEPIFLRPTDQAWPHAIDYLRELSAAGHRFVAHNWSFDGRVLHELLDVPYPRAVCTIEMAGGAWPNQPGGYSLDNLARTLHLPSGHKLGHGHEVCGMSPEQLAAYCIQDVRLCRDIYNLALTRLPPEEMEILELCSRAKECYFEVDLEAVDRAVAKFIDQADQHATALAATIGDKSLLAFGSDDLGHVRSIKPHVVKRMLLEHLGFDTQSISTKKVNPVALAAHAKAQSAITSASKSNKALSNKRKIGVFTGVEHVHAELNAWAAHTGRFASRAVGRGLNLLNMPKHDKDVAPLYRKSFRLPGGMVFVRADEANVEYRVSGLLTGCLTVLRLFERQVFADPYGNFGMLVTGRQIAKGDVIRQLFKMAVLGLGYGMGLELWVRQLLMARAKEKPDFTLADLRQVCETNHWGFPAGGLGKRLVTKLGCDPIVVTAAFHTRKAFHDLHPEFGTVARWLMRACETASRVGSQAAIDEMYLEPNAPSRDLIDLRVTDRFEGVSIEGWCPASGWPHPAVIWRDLAVRDIPMRGVCLSMISGRKGYRAVSPSICIENMVQAVSRQRTVRAKLQLAEMGYPYIFNVHDELLPVVLANPDSVIQARLDLTTVLGPHTRDAWGWAVCINPDEINVSQSWYEVDVGRLLNPTGTNAKGENIYPPSSEWWAQLAGPGGAKLLENLP